MFNANDSSMNGTCNTYVQYSAQKTTSHALCSASNLRAREKKKENHCSSRLSRSRFTLSRAYESCLACQRLFHTDLDTKHL